MISLSPAFLEYLRSDGIVLPPEDNAYQSISNDDNSGQFSRVASPTISDTEDDESDPSLAWLDIHGKVKTTIAELDGSVVPKLNWSAPKDATWIATTNSMECCTPNDVYLLLKSSDFITHDLECAFDDCEDDSEKYATSAEEENDAIAPRANTQSIGMPNEIPYHLVLRKTIPSITTSLEFRCFVRGRLLLCACQRDLNHYDFLFALEPTILNLIQKFFISNLKETFPDENFVFDVYIPPPHSRVWLIDINPWAPRTDPLLFSWLEILEMEGTDHREAISGLKISEGNSESDDSLEGEILLEPELRLLKRDDPEAYGFSTPQYSAHKLPKDVVDASADGRSGLTEFMGQWRDIVAAQKRDDFGKE